MAGCRHPGRRARSSELAGGLCGPPANFFLLGRHDLVDLVRPLLDIARRSVDRRAVLCSLIVAAAGVTPPQQLTAWADEVQSIDRRSPTGLGALMRWLALAWSGRFSEAVDVCVAASEDRRLDRDHPRPARGDRHPRSLQPHGGTGRPPRPARPGHRGGGSRGDGADPGELPARSRMGARRERPGSLDLLGPPRTRRHRRGAHADEVDAAGERLAAAVGARSRHRGRVRCWLRSTWRLATRLPT